MNYYSKNNLKALTLTAILPIIILCLSLIFPRAVLVSAQNEEDNTIPDFKETDTEALLAWEAPQELMAEYPYYLSGFDEEDSPIWIAEMGKWDTRKSVESGPEREKNYRRYILQFLARVKESTALRSTVDNPITEFNFIFDMEGYTVRQTSSAQALAMTLWMARQFEQAFRDRLRTGYIVNGNFVFTTVWNLIKPILGPNVYKVEVFGSNKAHWLPIVVKTFPRSQLPQWYGGGEGFTPVQVYG